MRSCVLAIALCAATAGGSARSAEAEPVARQNSESAAKVAREAPSKAAAAPRRCRATRSRAPCRATHAYVAAGTAAAVVAPVEAPMLPPLGAHVWRHEDPPLFDPYESAGPWYTGPWVHPGTNIAQWRYGFPGGHVDWHRGLGWRPGFGWF